MRTILRNFINVLRRFKMASFLNIVGLTVAFTAFLVIMMQVEYEHNFDRCYPDYDRIFRVQHHKDVDDPYAAILPIPFMEAVTTSSPHIKAGTLVTALAAQFNGKMYFTVEKDGKKNGFIEQFSACTPEILQVFNPTLLEGDDNCLQDPEKALIPQSIANRLFGNEPAVGQQLHMNEKVYMREDIKTFTVGGVYRDFPSNSQMYNAIYVKINKSLENNWGSQGFIGYVLLDSPDSKEIVEETFNKTFDYASHDFPETSRLKLLPVADTYYVKGLQEGIFKEGNPETVRLLILIAFLVIIIAGINFTNFSTSLAPLRIKSINTQKVLGSTTGSLRRGLITEAVGISILAFMLSLLLLFFLNRMNILSFVEADTNPLNHFYLLVIMGVIALLLGLAAGAYPACYMTSFQPALVLKGSFGLSASGRKLRTVLIGFQYIVSIGLIIGASFIQIQNKYMRSFDRGFNEDQIAVVTLNQNIYKNAKDVYVDKLKSYSGIADVAFSNQKFGLQDVYSTSSTYYNGKEINTPWITVSPNFLRVMDIPVIDGRDFTESDGRDSVLTFIYNSTTQKTFQLEAGHALDKFWKGEARIAGFVNDLKLTSLRQSGTPVSFIVDPGETMSVSFIRLNAGTNMAEAIGHIRQSLAEIDPTYPLDINFYDTMLDNLYHKEQYLKKMITLFSLLAIVLSIVGVFGLVVFETQYRRKEIGVRKVFGATVGEILNMFNKSYLRIVAICFVIAVPFAYYGVHKWLESFSDKTPIYWWVFALAFVIVAAITMLTVTFQNWKAANENPVNSVKSE